jgi:hypothetical protein
VPVTSTTKIPTATLSTPCVTKRADEMDGVEKREVEIEAEDLLERDEEFEEVTASSAFQITPKAGVALIGFLLASLTMF